MAANVGAVLCDTSSWWVRSPRTTVAWTKWQVASAAKRDIEMMARVCSFALELKAQLCRAVLGLARVVHAQRTAPSEYLYLVVRRPPDGGARPTLKGYDGSTGALLCSSSCRCFVDFTMHTVPFHVNPSLAVNATALSKDSAPCNVQVHIRWRVKATLDRVMGQQWCIKVLLNDTLSVCARPCIKVLLNDTLSVCARPCKLKVSL